MEHHCKGEQLPGSADSATGTCATPPTAQGAVDLVCNGKDWLAELVGV